MPLLRRVQLDATLRGQLFLTHLPGRHGPLSNHFEEMRALGVTAIVCLLDDAEIADKSPQYARAIATGELPCPVLRFPIADYGVPADREGFCRFVRDLARRLQGGERLVIHCAAGIGRTGTAAACVLTAAGIDPDTARRLIADAGSGAETAEQRSLITWIAVQCQLHPQDQPPPAPPGQTPT